MFQEQQPRGLLGIVQHSGSAGLFPQHFVDIFKRLFKHEVLRVMNGCGPGCFLVSLLGYLFSLLVSLLVGTDPFSGASSIRLLTAISGTLFSTVIRIGKNVVLVGAILLPLKRHILYVLQCTIKA